MRFGEFLKQHRAQLRIPLREFCRCNSLDPAYISKLERGVVSPPKSAKALERLAVALKIKSGTPKWQELFDLAAIEKGMIPSDLLSNRELCEKLPMVFRTLRGNILSKEKLDEVISIIKNVWENGNSRNRA